MGTFVLISHWLACIFYAIAYYERLMPDALPIGWLDGLANKTGMPYMANDSLSGPDTGTRLIRFQMKLQTFDNVNKQNEIEVEAASQMFSCFQLHYVALFHLHHSD